MNVNENISRVCKDGSGRRISFISRVQIKAISEMRLKIISKLSEQIRLDETRPRLEYKFHVQQL